MRTGEGKTLVATLAAYLNALTGEGVHIVTVNDYLAKRDAEWMGPVYNFLGLTVGIIFPICRRPKNKKLMMLILLMALIMNLVLIICATTWCSVLNEKVQRN